MTDANSWLNVIT